MACKRSWNEGEFIHVHLDDKSGWDSSSNGKFPTAGRRLRIFKESETTVQAIPV